MGLHDCRARSLRSRRCRIEPHVEAPKLLSDRNRPGVASQLDELRSQTLLGEQEAKLALREGWYHTKAGAGSQVLVYYTEEQDEMANSRVTSKTIRGGCQDDTETGKNMLADGVEASSFGEAFTGEKEAPELLGALGAKALEDEKVSTGLGAGAASMKRPAAAPPSTRLLPG